MEIEEGNLRMLLSSGIGQVYGQSIINVVRKGDAVLVHCEDGTILRISDPAMTRQILSDVFGWPTKDEVEAMEEDA
jgi:hypothetical protein